MRKQFQWAGALVAAVCLACGGEEPTPTPAPDDALGLDEAPLSADDAPTGTATGLRVDRVTLDPRDPVPGMTVRAEARFSGAPAHQVQLAYEWFVNGRRQTVTDGQFRLGEDIQRGDRIEVSVAARTAEGRSEPVRASLRVGNSPPTLHALALDPSPAIDASSDLRVVPKAADRDGDELEFEVEWEVNGDRVSTSDGVLPKEEFKAGDRVRVSVRATDGEDWSKEISSDPFTIGNAPPRITSTPGGFDDLGRFVYAVQVEDADGGRGLSFRLLEGPEGMSIDPVEGIVNWVPNESQAGVHPVDIEVRDSKGGVTNQSFKIELGFEDAAEVVPAAAEEPF